MSQDLMWRKILKSFWILRWSKQGLKGQLNCHSLGWCTPVVRLPSSATCSDHLVLIGSEDKIILLRIWIYMCISRWMPFTERSSEATKIQSRSDVYLRRFRRRQFHIGVLDMSSVLSSYIFSISQQYFFLMINYDKSANNIFNHEFLYQQ